MRFLAAPWVGMLRDGAWLRHAAHANAMAALLEAEVAKIPGVKMLYPRQANSVFVRMPDSRGRGPPRGGLALLRLHRRGARLMCAWDTTPEDIKSFTAALGKAAGAL